VKFIVANALDVKRLLGITLAAAFFFAESLLIVAQVAAQADKPPSAQSNPLPFTTQIKKTVIFIQTNCLHQPTADELAGLTPEEREKWTPDAIAKLKPDDLAKMKTDPHSGTGFIVTVPDERLAKDLGFSYLVTNRHVVQPGIEDGKPCKVIGYSLLLNHRGTSEHDPDHLQPVPVSSENMWWFPHDESVDLAVSGFGAPQTEWDYQTIPISMFVSPEMVAQKQVVEGDPVIFAGLFIQYSGSSKLEPIVRSGSIAMLPDDLIDTTLKKPGHIYLAEAHTFGGNSGSPMFVDVNKFKGSIGFDYRFLGVVTGEVYESNDLTLQTAATYKGSLPANSDISIIVPSEEVKKMIFSPVIQSARDQYVANVLRLRK
jgi:hypothetical protein